MTEWNDSGRVLTQTLADGREIRTSYDANGNVASITPPSRPAHSFTYTPVDLEESYTPPDLGIGSVATTYSYNPDRQLTAITRPDGQTLSLDYDTGSRLSTLTEPRGQTTFTYHPTTSQLTGITAPDGGTLLYTYDGALLTGSTWTGHVAGSVSRTYDTDFRVATESVNGGNSITFQYDPDSLLTGAGALALARHPQHGLLTGTTLGEACVPLEQSAQVLRSLRFDFDSRADQRNARAEQCCELGLQSTPSALPCGNLGTESRWMCRAVSAILVPEQGVCGPISNGLSLEMP